MGDSLARLSLFKSAAYTNEAAGEDSVNDELKAVLIAATSAASSYCGRSLASDTFEEYYTGNDTKRLFLNNGPVISVEYVKLWDGTDSYDTETNTYYQVFSNYIFYPRLGQEASATWSCWISDYEAGIIVKYTGGYPTNDWDNAAITDAWHVPPDLEHAVCQIGMKIWYDAKSSGARFGLSSVNRDGGLGYDKFVRGLPEDTLMVLNNYRGGMI